jgi:hypothetical protein
VRTDHHSAAVAALRAAQRGVLRLIYRGPACADRRPLTEVVDAIDRAVVLIRAERATKRRRGPRVLRLVRD